MKYATTLVVVIVLAAAATIYWAIGAYRLSMWPGFRTEAPQPQAAAPPEAKPEPVKKPVVRKAVQAESKPAPAPVPEVVAAVPAPPPPSPVEAKPELPFPKPADVTVGAERTQLLESFHEPTIRSVSNEDGDLVETYVYAAPGTPKDTWVVLVNGEVAAKYATDHTPAPAIEARRRARTAPRQLN